MFIHVQLHCIHYSVAWHSSHLPYMYMYNVPILGGVVKLHSFAKFCDHYYLHVHVYAHCMLHLVPKMTTHKCIMCYTSKSPSDPKVHGVRKNLLCWLYVYTNVHVHVSFILFIIGTTTIEQAIRDGTVLGTEVSITTCTLHVYTCTWQLSCDATLMVCNRQKKDYCVVKSWMSHL